MWSRDWTVGTSGAAGWHWRHCSVWTVYELEMLKETLMQLVLCVELVYELEDPTVNTDTGDAAGVAGSTGDPGAWTGDAAGDTGVQTRTGAGDTGVWTRTGFGNTGATGVAGPVTGGFCFFFWWWVGGGGIWHNLAGLLHCCHHGHWTGVGSGWGVHSGAGISGSTSVSGSTCTGGPVSFDCNACSRCPTSVTFIGSI